MSDLTKTLLSEEIRRINLTHRSGILECSDGEDTKGLFFRSGRIVFASSTREDDKLGQNLLRLGRISRAEFAYAYSVQGPKRRFGEALVGAGIMTEEELGRLVAHQVQTIILSLFTWTKGAARFHESPDPIPADLAVELSTHRLLFEGARIFPEVARLERALGSQKRRLQLAARPPFEFARLSLSPAERAVIEAAKQGQRVSSLLASGVAPRPLLVRGTYALLAAGIVEEYGNEDTGSVEVEVDTGTFRLAMAASAAAPPPASVDPRSSILRLYEALPRATHYELLGVGPDSTPAQIEAAHRRVEAEQEQWRGLERDARVGSMVSTLRLRRREAHRILSDPGRRIAYDRALEQLRGSRPEPEAPGAETQDPVRLTREAERLLGRGDAEQAVVLLLEAVREDPGNLRQRRLLALALAEHPVLLTSAERHFLTVLERDPRDAELRFKLALYYKRAGHLKRALAQLQTVLSDAPQMERAQDELAAVEALLRAKA